MPAYKKIDASTDVGKRTIEGLLRLREALDGSEKYKIPPKTVDPTLLLATWNIREFGKFGKTGETGRDQEALFYIAEIISRFDIVAVQEVLGNLDALDELMGILGVWWKYLVSDATVGTAGGSERHACIYDTRKVVFGGMVGEVVPEATKIKAKVMDKDGNEKEVELLSSFSFARTPYIACFRAGWFKFTICTQHFFYGKAEANDPQRLEEARKITKLLSDRINRKSKENWAYNTILLGDFNIFSVEDETFGVIENMNFKIPPNLKGKYTNASADKPFDQIAFLACDEVWKMDQLRSGAFPFFDYVFRDQDCGVYTPEKTLPKYRNWRTYKMSDHLPLWVELRVDFGAEYLNAKKDAQTAKKIKEQYQEPVG